MVLEGCGAVCETTGALVLFTPTSLAGAFTELLTDFLLSATFLSLVSVKVARVFPLTAVELHLVAGLSDVWKVTLYGWPFVSRSLRGLGFMDRSAGRPADLLVVKFANGLEGAAAHLEDVDLGPLDACLLYIG